MNNFKKLRCFLAVVLALQMQQAGFVATYAQSKVQKGSIARDTAIKGSVTKTDDGNQHYPVAVASQQMIPKITELTNSSKYMHNRYYGDNAVQLMKRRFAADGVPANTASYADDWGGWLFQTWGTTEETFYKYHINTLEFALRNMQTQGFITSFDIDYYSNGVRSWRKYHEKFMGLYEKDLEYYSKIAQALSRRDAVKKQADYFRRNGVEAQAVVLDAEAAKIEAQKKQLVQEQTAVIEQIAELNRIKLFEAKPPKDSFRLIDISLDGGDKAAIDRIKTLIKQNTDKAHSISEEMNKLSKQRAETKNKISAKQNEFERSKRAVKIIDDMLTKSLYAGEAHLLPLIKERKASIKQQEKERDEIRAELDALEKASKEDDGKILMLRDKLGKILRGIFEDNSKIQDYQQRLKDRADEQYKNNGTEIEAVKNRLVTEYKHRDQLASELGELQKVDEKTANDMSSKFNERASVLKDCSNLLQELNRIAVPPDVSVELFVDDRQVYQKNLEQDQNLANTESLAKELIGYQREMDKAQANKNKALAMFLEENRKAQEVLRKLAGDNTSENGLFGILNNSGIIMVNAKACALIDFAVDIGEILEAAQKGGVYGAGIESLRKLIINSFNVLYDDQMSPSGVNPYSAAEAFNELYGADLTDPYSKNSLVRTGFSRVIDQITPEPWEALCKSIIPASKLAEENKMMEEFLENIVNLESIYESAANLQIGIIRDSYRTVLKSQFYDYEFRAWKEFFLSANRAKGLFLTYQIAMNNYIQAYNSFHSVYLTAAMAKGNEQYIVLDPSVYVSVSQKLAIKTKASCLHLQETVKLQGVEMKSVAVAEPIHVSETIVPESFPEPSYKRTIRLKVFQRRL